jgi:predicted O-linked N-acetylglucosamine transferase (SPINDLY family)
VGSDTAAWVDAAYRQALSLHQQGRIEDARLLCQRSLQHQPQHFGALHLLGVIAGQSNHPELAAALIAEALKIDPQNIAAHNNYGNALCQLNRHEAAVESYDRAIALEPHYTDALYNRGNALRALALYEPAVASYEKVIALSPNHAAAHYNRGNALVALGQREAAIASFDLAIAHSPNSAEAHYHRGITLIELKRYEAAVQGFDKAIALRPDFAEAWVNRGFSLVQMLRHEDAIASYDKAIALRPDFVQAHDNRGTALFQLLEYPAAVASYDKAIALSPNVAQSYYNRGMALLELEQHRAAVASFDKAQALDAHFRFLDGARLNAKIQICDWDGLEIALPHITARIEDGEPVCAPFLVMALTDSAALQRKAAEIWVQHEHPPISTLPPTSKPGKRDRIRVAWFSGDLHQHPVSMLTAELFETLDRSRFELTAFSFGAATQDTMRQRMQRAFDRFIDVRMETDENIALLARRLGLHIAVDLGGFTHGSRPNIFATRAAPIQVSYLGYSGTMGAEYIDYLIGDLTVIPEEHQRHYREKIIYLPHSYLAHDSKRGIADRMFTREELGLPRSGFVFCCFNSSYKITPSAFDAWMRILTRVEDSVLWLSIGNPQAVANLRREAVRRGINPKRLIFAEPMASPSDHLSRHRAADLFIDTFPYNAHTTASDALWAGLPVLTCIGQAFAGRVAASLLNAIGLPELICSTRQRYEDLAVELALDPERLAAVKQKLANQRLTTPLFDTPLFVRDFESALTHICERDQAGLPPDHVKVVTLR